MKITTLIPAYKIQYLPDLLNGLRLQTSPVGKILISDDSPGGIFRNALYSEPFAALRDGLDIEFHEGPRIGAQENVKHLVRLWGGRSELVHVLLDDDVLYPEFYERHIAAHAAADISCSVSRRWTANEVGFPVTGQPVPEVLRHQPNRMVLLDSSFLLATTVAECKNWLGEFSNMVIRADCMDLVFEPELGGVSYAGLWDLGFFICASTRRPLCHIQDHLGYFRIGPDQNSSKLYGPFMKSAHLGYVALALGANRAGRMSEELKRQCCALLSPALVQRYALQPDMAPFVALLPHMAQGVPGADDQFIQAWQVFLAQNGF